MRDTPTVVITGGTGGLGTALAKRLAKGSARMAVTYLIPAEAEAFERQVELEDDRLLLRRVDANDSEQVAAFVKATADKFGSIDALCSLVGGWAGARDVEETDDLRFDRMLDLNLRSAFIAVRAALPYLRKAGVGRIILMGSRAAADTPSGQVAFNIAKAGVVALAKTVASELDQTDVTANVLMPSVIDTPATRAALPYADYVSWPTPDEIAAVIEYLLSPGSQVINGADIPVYGHT